MTATAESTHDAGFGAVLRKSVATLNPGYFAFVMATGIVSVAMKNKDQTVLSLAMLALAAAAAVWLTLLTLWRAVVYPGEFRADFTDPARGFGFFTFVAAYDVVGTRFTAEGQFTVSIVLLCIGAVAWAVLGYIVPWTAVLHPSRRPSLHFANGTWFIWVVASQSVAVLSAAIEPHVHTGRAFLALVAVFSWSVGAFLYPTAAILVTTRLMLYPLRPADLTPPYWVAMGATAITVVAGARIVQMADAPIVIAARGLIAGSAVLFWCFGTWLIPVLLAAAWWRHVTNHYPLRYDPTLWSIVFPLGMYGVAGQYLSEADHIPFLATIGGIAAWVALAVWAAVLVWMLVHLATTFGRPLLRLSGPAGTSAT